MARNLAQFLETHPISTAFILRIWLSRCKLDGGFWKSGWFCRTGSQGVTEKLVAFAEDDVLPERCWRGGGGRESGRDTGFMSADDSTALLHRWVEQNAVHKIARFWTEGFHVDWYQLYPIATPCRISLPGYPFARERH